MDKNGILGPNKGRYNQIGANNKLTSKGPDELFGAMFEPTST